MKKTYYARRNNALIRQPSVLIGGACLVIVLVLVVMRLVIPGVLVSVAAPFWRASAAADDAFRSGSVTFTSPAKLQSALDTANADRAALTDENKTLAAQVVDLQKLLGSRAEVPPSVVASVLARPPESPYDTLVIDQGSRATVAPEALVTGPGGVPVGRINSVTAASARVTLFSSPGVVTDAWAGQSRVPVSISGVGSGAFEASVPKDAAIVVGDSVYIADQGAAAMGTVIRIDADPSATTATLRIEPLINPFSLTWVLVSRS